MTVLDPTGQVVRLVALDCLGYCVNGATLVFVGEADLTSVGTIVAAVDEAPPVWLDLSGVTYMDSSGLRALLDARSRLPTRADDSWLMHARDRSSGCSRSPVSPTLSASRERGGSSERAGMFAILDGGSASHVMDAMNEERASSI